MKRIDYLIFTGLVASLILFLLLTSYQGQIQDDRLLSNQRLIKEALNSTKTNTELILENQQIILRLANDQDDVIDRINNVQRQLDNHVDRTNNFSRSP